MSYSIIFQTKILRLSDGRIVHLSRQGCNNDNAGRERGVYEGKIYTKPEFDAFVKKFEDLDSGHGSWNLKIGSRYATYKDYADHLRRMLKRATAWESLAEKARENCTCRPYVRYLASVDVNTEGGESLTFTEKEWDKVCYDYWYSGCRMTYHYEFAYDVDEITGLLDEGRHLEFHVA